MNQIFNASNYYNLAQAVKDTTMGASSQLLPLVPLAVINEYVNLIGGLELAAGLYSTTRGFNGLSEKSIQWIKGKKPSYKSVASDIYYLTTGVIQLSRPFVNTTKMQALSSLTRLILGASGFYRGVGQVKEALFNTSARDWKKFGAGLVSMGLGTLGCWSASQQMKFNWEDAFANSDMETAIKLCEAKRTPSEEILVSAISQKKREWVSLLVKCGAPNFDFNSLTPARAWFLRYPDEPMPEGVQLTSLDHEILQRTVLSHLFEVAHTTVLNNIEYPLEGASPWFFISHIVELTQEVTKRNQTLSEMHLLPLFENAIKSRNQDIDFNVLPISIVPAGIIEHATALVLSKNFIAHINQWVEIKKYDSSMLTGSELEIFQNRLTLTDATYNQAINALENKTGARLIFLVGDHLAQKIGNCAFKSVEGSIFAYRVIDSFEKGIIEEEQRFQEIFSECFNNLPLSQAQTITREAAWEICGEKSSLQARTLMIEKWEKTFSEYAEDHKELQKAMRNIAYDTYQDFRNRLNQEDKEMLPLDQDLMAAIEKIR